jgi:CRP/FNR family transcriptional regulator, anaerobic regulatory protein
MQTGELIKKTFPHFEPSLIQRLVEIGEVKEFVEDDELLRTGQYFKNSMLLLDGLVKLYREGEDGNEFFMYYIQPGQACALSMICATKNETSAIMAKAVSSVKMLSIPIQYMDELMQQYKSWYYFVVENYRARFEELLLTIDSIAFKAMDERLEFYLKRAVETTNSKVLHINHQIIANELNSSREVISRLLKKMEQLGKVKMGRNSIEVIGL